MTYINNIILQDEKDEKRYEIHLLNSIYLYWIHNFINKDYIYSISPILILILFKKYIMNYNRNIYLLSIDHIDKRIRYYYLSSKFLKKWITKYVNKKEPVNTEDLQLNVIDILSNINYINYIDFSERKRYLFTENDFRKIVISSFHNSYEYDIDPDPINIRNPYTNKEFTKTELRSFNNNIRDMPIVWNMFVDSDFDTVKLKYKYYTPLLEICIPNYVDKLGDLDIVDYLIDIFIYSNIIYCERCMIERRNIRLRKVKNSIINWIRYLKLNQVMSNKSIEDLKNIYSKISCFHINPVNPYSLPFNNFLLNTLDFTKPLFCVGYTTKEDKKLYWKRMREKNRKSKNCI